MGKNQANKAIDLVNSICKDKTMEIEQEKLINYIKMEIGADMKRVIIPYLKLMADLKLIEETDDPKTWRLVRYDRLIKLNDL